MKLNRLLFCTIMIPLLSCQQPTTYAPPVSQGELQQEEITQAQMVTQAAEQGGMPRPWRNRPGMKGQFERVADRIDTAGAKLCQEMGLPKKNHRCYYYFSLSYSRDLNARADGQTIFMNSGMMRFLQNDNEVAIVLGHELAHNLMAHMDAKKDNAFLGMLMGAALDGLTHTPGGDGAKSGAEIGALTYSVEFEEEADYVGLYIAARAGYDISQAPALWRRMSLEDPRELFNGYDHPSNAERAAALQKAVEEIEYKRQHHLALLPAMKENLQDIEPAAGNF